MSAHPRATMKQTPTRRDALLLGEALRLLGPQDPTTLSIRAVLARGYRATGRLGDAIALAQQILPERLSGSWWKFENGDPGVNYLRRLKRRPPAPGSRGSWRLVAGRERTLGPRHANTRIARANLARSYWSAGRIGDAIEVGQRVLTQSQAAAGREHPDTIAAAANLAAFYEGAGLLARAIEL